MLLFLILPPLHLFVCVCVSERERGSLYVCLFRMYRICQQILFGSCLSFIHSFIHLLIPVCNFQNDTFRFSYNTSTHSVNEQKVENLTILSSFLLVREVTVDTNVQAFYVYFIFPQIISNLAKTTETISYSH